MYYEDLSTSALPCSKPYHFPEPTTAPKHFEFYRKESNGTEIFLNLKGRRIYFKAKDINKIFPLDAPLQVDFELTQKCNLDCRHCFLTNKTESFSNKTMATLNKLIAAGVVIFELGGGEPLLVKDIFKIIRHLKKHNKIITITTNGTLITTETAKKLAKCQPDKIYISLDGPKNIHEVIRGKGSFTSALSGIRELNKFGIKPTISMTLNKLNINSILDLLDEIKSLKIKSLFLICTEPSNSDPNFKKYCFLHKDYPRLGRMLARLKFPKTLKVNACFVPQNINALYYGCFFRLTMCKVTPSGNVLACPIVRDIKGNVFERDFKEIWKSMYEELVRDKPSNCKNCDWSNICFPCKFREAN